MPTQTIDIPLPESLTKALQTPVCIPLPKPGSVEITLPFGGATIKAFNDISKGIPDDCSLSFSLALQIAPLLANMKCLIEALKVIGPLIDTIKALATLDPFKIASAMEKLLPAVVPLVECITKFFVGVPFFLRDLLALIAKLLRCIVAQLRSILNVMSGLALQITSAKSEGNTELLATLECAQRNAETSAQHSMSAIEPIMVLLSLAEPLFGLAGVDPIKTPQIGSDSSLEGLQSVIDVLDEIAKTLQLVAEGLGAPHAS
ncbi:hypothetical protein AWB81_05826 [Caballeronia arationis]|jgi:hypothetical protein|uniref:Uncharacterized protein n=1 Tax=Caballeronia arationis TaxID=1777142 RepID=A0A7Z7N0K5_9BURK|nr:hypothetical protein [Caballeronia arationis]SAK99983.1 hypothetical protein AWB81_05826 [Caballeronia arationis]SOE54443.1 hypothetical protein SAMN05446927_0827 [Caballeronia arationis]